MSTAHTQTLGASTGEYLAEIVQFFVDLVRPRNSSADFFPQFRPMILSKPVHGSFYCAQGQSESRRGLLI